MRFGVAKDIGRERGLNFNPFPHRPQWSNGFGAGGEVYCVGRTGHRRKRGKPVSCQPDFGERGVRGARGCTLAVLLRRARTGITAAPPQEPHLAGTPVRTKNKYFTKKR